MPYANPENKREANRQYRESNREYLKELRRKWYRDNPDREKANRERYVHANRDKIKARNAAYAALQRGEIHRRPCEYEDSGNCDGSIHMHHDDYSRPLDVRFLCAVHHGCEHRTVGDA